MDGEVALEIRMMSCGAFFGVCFALDMVDDDREGLSREEGSVLPWRKKGGLLKAWDERTSLP